MGSNATIKKIDPSQIRYTPQQGEVIQDLEGNFFVWKDDKWITVKSENEGIQMGLYEMNKQIIDQLPALDRTEIVNKMVGIQALHDHFQNKYYMLYGKEISYFTVFEIIVPHRFSLDVIDCLNNIGEIKAIDNDTTGSAMEIWVQAEDGPTCLYLFPYDNGIVRVGE